MIGGGAIQGMIDSLKANRKLLKRNSAFAKYKEKLQFVHSKKNLTIKNLLLKK